MNAGLDQSAGASWKSFHRTDGYTGKIGTSTSYLIVKIVDKLIYEGTEDAYIDVSNLALPWARIRSDGTSKGLHFKCGTGAADCDVMWIQKGYFWHEAGTIAKTFMESWNSIAVDARVVLNDGTMTLVEKTGGILTMNGGTLTVLNNRGGSSTIVGGTLTNLDQDAGGVYWETADGTLVDAKIFGGVFSAAGDARAKTIGHIEMHGDAIVDLDNGKDNITLTEGGIYTYGSQVPRMSAVEIGNMGGVPV